jgi:uncharacterized phage-associated protein
LEFQYDKSLEAAAYLLRLNHGSMNYMRLLKLLYIADRELLTETATVLTGDCYKAMDYGPVLSMVYDHIRGRAWTNPDWGRHIKTAPGFQAVLEEDPGVSHLSRAATEKLIEITERYRGKSEWAMVDLTHDFPEWDKNRPPQGGSKIIPLEDIVEATRANPEILITIREQEAARREMDDLFDDLELEEPAEASLGR